MHMNYALTGAVSLMPQAIGRFGRVKSMVEFCSAHSELMWCRLLITCAFVHLSDELLAGRQTGVMVLDLREILTAALISHQ